MDLFGILFLVVLVVALFAFIYFLYQSASRWGWLHSILVTLMFLMTIGLLYSTAGVLSVRVGWSKSYKEAEDKYEKATAETRKLRIGDLTKPELDPEALSTVQNELANLRLDRGRVWAAAEMQSANADGVVLKLSAEDAKAAESLAKETIVYGFAETQAADGLMLPTYYLGEWFVKDNAGGQVTLTPTLVSPSQVAMLSNPQANRWTLFELMPLDTHDAFAEVGSKGTNEQIFGRMDEAVLGNLLANSPESMKAKTISNYVRDGKPANADDPPESIWIRIKFKKDYAIEVDSLEVRNALDGGYFDPSGRTVDSRLKRGEGKEKVEFKADDEVDMKSEPAQELIDNGTAELIERYFVRPLNDYEASFRILQSRGFAVDKRIEWVTRETAVIAAANELGVQQVQARQVEIANLKKEQAQYAKELEVVQAEAKRLEAEVDAVREKLSETFRRIQAAHAEILKTQKELADKIGPGLANAR